MTSLVPPPAAPRAALPGILIVEDDANTRELWELTFREAGFRVFLAGSIAGGLAVLRSGESIDVVVTDYWLGDGVGEAMLREADAAGLMREVVGSLICTSHRAIQASSYARVVHKPITPSDLVAAVRKLLE